MQSTSKKIYYQHIESHTRFLQDFAVIVQSCMLEYVTHFSVVGEFFLIGNFHI